MRLIKYASLKLANYKNQNIKVNCKEYILARLREFFYFQEIFCKDQVKNNDIYISILSKQNQIRNQILVIENRDKKEWIESLYNIKIFPFTYNGTANKKPNLGHNIEKF